MRLPYCISAGCQGTVTFTQVLLLSPQVCLAGTQACLYLNEVILGGAQTPLFHFIVFLGSRYLRFLGSESSGAGIYRFIDKVTLLFLVDNLLLQRDQSFS